MRFVILLILIISKICSSSVLFRINSNNKNVSINSSYLFGTMHVAQNLIWPYLSNDTIRILTESDQVWMEHDFTDPQISKYIYGCTIDKMSITQRARLRAKSWSRFVNETSNDKSTKFKTKPILKQWREWFVDDMILSTDYLQRNKTVDNAIILDHRIILEAYQRGTYVGSLESIPTDCFLVGNPNNNKISNESNYQIIFSRAYNCDMINEDFVKEVYKLLGFIKMKNRNQQITTHIRKLLKKDPQQKYLFAVGAAHLFGNISIVQMLKDQFNDDYYIEQIDSPSPDFSYQNCTDEEFERLANEINTVQNKTFVTRSIKDDFFERNVHLTKYSSIYLK